MGESSLTSVDLLQRGHHKIVIICGSDQKLYSNNLNVKKTGVILKVMDFKGYTMNGLGNDFLILDNRTKPTILSNEQIRHLANRDNIGFDQLIIIESGNDSAHNILFYNSDGEEAEACGNGSRCVAHFLMEEKKIKKISINTKSGILNSIDNGNKNITIDMGEPIFDWEKIPLSEEMDPSNVCITLKDNSSFDGYALSVGNPHIIFFNDIETDKLKIIGPEIENHKTFPKKCNVTFAKIIDQNNIKVNVWERGAGLTKACGTGACATAVASAKKNLTERLVNIHFQTGKLSIDWKENNRIHMSGPVSDIQEVNISI